MTMRLLFWVLMLLWLVLGSYFIYPVAASGSYGLAVNNLLVFVLLGLLGWKVFGQPVSG